MEVFVVVINTHVEKLEKPITPKLVPLATYWGRSLGYFDWYYHTCLWSFKTLKIVPKDTYIVKRSRFKYVLIVEPVDTTSEKHVDDLYVGVEQVILGD